MHSASSFAAALVSKNLHRISLRVNPFLLPLYKVLKIHPQVFHRHYFEARTTSWYKRGGHEAYLQFRVRIRCSFVNKTLHAPFSWWQ